MKREIIIVFFMPLLFWGCPEVETNSPIPEIEFKSFNIYEGVDSLGNVRPEGLLEFSFIDGDADLGVYDEVNNNPLLPDSVRYGIFIDFFEKLDGNYYERFFTQIIYVTDTIKDNDTTIYVDSSYIDTLTFNEFLPYDEKFDRVGQYKTVKGVIKVKIPFDIEPPYDTMRFEFYIRDRALNKSNVQYTNDFTVEPISGTPGGL